MKISLTIIFLLMVHDLLAFTLVASGRVRFAGNEVTVNVTSTSCANAGMDVNTLLDLVGEAVDSYWNTVPTSALVLKKGSILTTESTSDTTAQLIEKTAAETILIGCSDGENYTDNPFTSSGIGGVGTINIANGVTRGVVLINGNAASGFGDLSHAQQMAVIAHELGHAIGIGHSGNPIALMHYTIAGKVQEKLTQDDYDAVTYLYPHQELTSSCGTVAFVNDDSSGGGMWQWGSCFFIGILLVSLNGLKKNCVKINQITSNR